MAFAPRKGGESGKEAAKSASSFGDRVEYFSLDDAEKITLRFLDDEPDWVYVSEHEFVPTREPEGVSDDRKKNWKTRMSAVCRKDPAFQGEFEDCFICDHLHEEKPNKDRKDGRWTTKIVYYVRALVREEVRATQEMIDEGLVPATTRTGQSMLGKLVGWDNATKEIDELDAEGNPTGNKIVVPRVILVNAKSGNFFAPLGGFAQMNDEGTILDCDFTIMREGTGTDTKYRFANLAPVKEDGEVWDMRNMEPVLDAEGNPTGEFTDRTLGQMYASAINIEEMIQRKAGDEWYARYFDTRVPFPVRESDNKDGKGESSNGSSGNGKPKAAPKGAPAEEQGKPEDEAPSAEAMAAMRAKLTKKSARGGMQIDESLAGAN